LAAAIACHADTIVTFDLRDFPAEVLGSFNVRAQHPDDFIVGLFESASEAVCTAVRQQRANLKRPRKSVDEFLASLERQSLPKTVKMLRGMADQL